MSQYANPGIRIGQSYFYNSCYFVGTAKFVTLGHHYQIYQFASFFFFRKGKNQLVQVGFGFGYQYVFGTRGNAAVKGNITCIATHYFYYKQPVVCICGISYFVYGFYCGINCRIKTNGEISTGNVLIYGAGNTNAGYVKFIAKSLRTPKAAITANNNQPFYAPFFKVIVCFFSSLGFHKFFAPCTFQYGSATLNNVGDTPAFHPYYIIIYHAAIAPHYAIYLQSMINAGTNYTPYCRIHTRAIATRGKDTYFFYFRIHN